MKNEISDIRFNIDNIRRISPDFTVLQTNIDFDQYHVAKGFMEYGGLTMLDVIVKSNYYSSGNYNVLCKLQGKVLKMLNIYTIMSWKRNLNL